MVVDVLLPAVGVRWGYGGARPAPSGGGYGGKVARGGRAPSGGRLRRGTCCPSAGNLWWGRAFRPEQSSSEHNGGGQQNNGPHRRKVRARASLVRAAIQAAFIFWATK